MYPETLGDSIDNCTELPNLQLFDFSQDLRFSLSSGKRFGPIRIAFKTFGKLNAQKSNAVLVFPTLTATPQVAGEEIGGKEFGGWWQEIVGKGKAIDTEKFFVVCPDHFGGCYGSTGPSNKNPDTGKEFGLSFPAFFTKDIVNCAFELLKHLGIAQLQAVAGGSLGGLLALEFSAANKGFAKNAFILGASHKVSAMAIALNHIARQAIMLDPGWNSGNYYGKGFAEGEFPKAPSKTSVLRGTESSSFPMFATAKGFPAKGLSIARQIGHISYLNHALLEQKFGRSEIGRQRKYVSLPLQYQIEGYLDYQGEKFCKRFDANSYIYLSKAIDSFDLEKEFGCLRNIFTGNRTKFEIISIASDILFPSADSKELHNAIKESGAKSYFHLIDSEKGHDAIFLENGKIGKIIEKKINK